MAKRKPKQQTADLETQAADEALEHEDVTDETDETPEQERAEAAPEGLGVRHYDPNGPLDLSDPNSRPGQGRHRDDELDAAYRREQGRTGPGQAITREAGDGLTGDRLSATPDPAQEHKPAEPTDASPADQIKGVPFPAAKPAIDALENDLVPGAGDPQNGVVTPEGSSPVSWARPDPATAQHYEGAEDPREVAKLRADPYANQPKDPATVPPDPFAYQRNPAPPQAAQQPAPQPQNPREDEPLTDAD